MRSNLPWLDAGCGTRASVSFSLATANAPISFAPIKPQSVIARFGAAIAYSRRQVTEEIRRPLWKTVCFYCRNSSRPVA